MKNPKILPFGQWFKVYESAGRNFERSQRILESRIARGLTRIYENFSIGDIKKVEPGNQIYDLYYETDSGLTDPENNAAFETKAKEVFGKTVIPNLRAFYLGSVRNEIQNEQSGSGSLTRGMEDFLKFYLTGIEKRLGDSSLSAALLDKEGFAILNKLDIKSTPDGEFDLYISSYTEISDDGTTTVLDKPRAIKLQSVLGYVNTFNLGNYAVGDYTQYIDPTTWIDSSNVLSLAKKEAVKKDEFALYLFTDRKVDVQAASKGFDITVTAAEAGTDVPFKLNYAQGEFKTDANNTTIDENHPDVIALANSIVGSLNAQKIEKMTLTSSASPEWGGLTTSGSGGAENPSPSLNDTNYKSDRTDAGNKYLAWRRGTYLVEILNKMLSNIITKIDTAWMIGEAGGAGRNCKYVITQLGKEGSTKIIPTFKGAKVVTSGSGLLKVYRHKVTFSEAELTAAKDTILKKFTGGLLGKSLIQYADVKEGQTVLYYGAVSDGDVTYIHVSPNYKGADKIVVGEKEIPVKKGGKLAKGTWKDHLIEGKAKKTVADNEGKLVVDFTNSAGTTVERTITRDRFYSAGQTREQVEEI